MKTKQIIICRLGIEPGASSETMLVTTDSFEEYQQEISGHIDEKQKENTIGVISEMREKDSSEPSTSNPIERMEQNQIIEENISQVIQICNNSCWH